MNDRMPDWVVFILLFAMGLFSLATTYNRSETRWRDEAVKHHAATYYLDKDNQRQWKWNDEGEKQ